MKPLKRLVKRQIQQPLFLLFFCTYYLCRIKIEIISPSMNARSSTENIIVSTTGKAPAISITSGRPPCLYTTLFVLHPVNTNNPNTNRVEMKTDIIFFTLTLLLFLKVLAIHAASRPNACYITIQLPATCSKPSI